MIKTIFIILLSLSMFSTITIARSGCGRVGCNGSSCKPRMSFKNQMKQKKFLTKLALSKEQDKTLKMINKKYGAAMDTLQDKSKENLESINVKMHNEMLLTLSEKQ